MNEENSKRFCSNAVDFRSEPILSSQLLAPFRNPTAYERETDHAGHPDRDSPRICSVVCLEQTRPTVHLEHDREAGHEKCGHDSKNAAKDTGRGVKKGTKEAYHSTKRGTRKTWNKTKNTTKGAVQGGKDGAKQPDENPK